MDDIAIQFDIVDLGGDKCIFKPITIIRGFYDKKENAFVNQAGIYCEPINGGDIDGIDFFGELTTINDLKELYKDEETEEDLLSEYFYMCNQNIYCGIYNKYGKIDLLPPLPIYEIQNQMQSYIENEEESMVSFDFDALKNLRDSKSIEEVRNKLDVFIKVLEGNVDKKDLLTNKDIRTLTNNKKVKLEKEESKRFNLMKLRKEVLSKIISQDNAVKSVTTTIAVNQQSKNPRHKSHILIAGPSGTGKTEMINIIAKYLDIPYFKADATSYTKEGYVGKSVYSMLNGLLDAADGDLEKAQNGILVIDEIDKKAFGKNDDPGGHAVLHSLLKIMDRDVIELNFEHSETISFDTSNLTIIFMGAFEEMFDKKKSNKKISIGFGNQNETKDDNLVTNKDFIEFGMPAEFMGRIGEVTYTNELTEKDLLKILRKSKISPIKIEQEYFNDLGVKINFTPGYLNEIARQSLKSRTGARDLKKLVHQSLIDIYEKTTLDPKVKTIKLTKDTALDPKKYYAQ